MVDSLITVVMIDSRSDLHPDWVQVAIDSVKRQIYPVKLIVVDNVGRKKTIGKCWNEAVKKVDTKWTLFLGDDDFLTRDYCATLAAYALDTSLDHVVAFTTNMTVFRETGGQVKQKELPRPCTGMWKTEYLRKYPFNEKLKKGIDREYIEEVEKRGDTKVLLPHQTGYNYRQHDDYSCAGKIELKTEQPEYYINAKYPSFIQPYYKRLKDEGYNVVVDNHPFNPYMVEKAKVIWCDWGDGNAAAISRFKTNARKILRIHAYEVFEPMLHYIELDAFDTIIFVAKHIKDYAERILNRKIKQAVVIPNGVDTDAFTIAPNKKWNNRIAWAGQISRKKGAGLLMFLAQNNPDFEFHVAGKFTEPDIAEFFNKTKPDNMHIEPYSYDLNEFFSDKTYILNTSLREGNPVTMLQGMSAGLKPITYKWVGSEYQPFYRFANLHDFRIHLIEAQYQDPIWNRTDIINDYNIKTIYPKIKEIMDGSHVSTNRNKGKNRDKSRPVQPDYLRPAR